MQHQMTKSPSTHHGSKASPAELSSFEILGKSIPYVRLITSPTPLQRGRYGNFEFMIKREDLTDCHVYGGNKVRNLEFILAKALIDKKTAIATPIPMGSNFSAAFAGHSKRLGLTPMLCQVNLADHPQIYDHLQFCEKQFAKITTRTGVLKFPMQLADLIRARIKDKAFIVPPGGSNALGVVGHLKAFMELANSIRAGDIECPEYIFVGAGTGGTTAGLIAGITVTGLPIKIVAVRCAEKIICNKTRILHLANEALKYLGSDKISHSGQMELIECPGNPRYGEPIANFRHVFKTFHDENGLELDRTYTSKVVTAMISRMGIALNPPTNVLYWHTFSAMASQELQRMVLS